MSYTEYLANSNTAFGSGEFQEALKYATLAIEADPKETEGYYAAGKACMSLNDPTAAMDYFKKSLELDKHNGNGYFLLGYAAAMADNSAEALRALTRALENDCDEVLKGQIYKIMAIINTEKNDFDNALLNLTQAERYIGVDTEILQQRAACYAGQNRYHDTLFTLNQLKLLQPANYQAYSLAFHVFLDLRMFEEAEAELKRAEEFAELNMTYYEDKMAFAMMHITDEMTEDELPAHWRKVLDCIDTALKKGKPDAQQAYEMYLRAAELYVSLEEYDKALACLDAAADPVASFNDGFSVLQQPLTMDAPASESGSLLSPEDEEERLEEMWENGEFDEMTEKMEEVMDELDADDPEEFAEAMQRYLTPLDSIPAEQPKDQEPYKISEPFEMDDMDRDMRTGLYLPVYEHLKDYDNLLQKARELQASSLVSSQYEGIYHELRVGKLKNDENWRVKYKDRINYWMKKMVEDPTDYLSATYRIRCYIDLGDIEKAKELIDCLPADMREPLLKEAENTNSNGGGENGTVS